ncbi:MAG: CotH kinase family protein, partial [Arenicellales bacterium]|nr:CotH kinase family protein [Arenicellales bacterium]
NRNETDLGVIGKYEITRLVQRVRAATVGKLTQQGTGLKVIHLFVPESNLATLESHMPQSGFNYVKARMLIDGKLEKVKVKYRGDFLYHWAFDKKSVRVRTTRQNLFEGVRLFNLQAPKALSQLNTYLSLQLAEQMKLLGPKTKLMRLYINGKDQGIRVFVEQLDESTLRAAQMMPGDLYRGEMVGKDQFSGIEKTTTLFNSSAVWDKMAINNHYDEASRAPLDKLLDLIRRRTSPEAQAELSSYLDMSAWGRFSVFEALAHTKHFSKNHNQRLYYDPWRGKIVPIVWDPAGWIWHPRSGKHTLGAVINTELHQALFLNGDFLRARSAALKEFFENKKDQKFLALVDGTVERMTAEIQADPFLRPGKPGTVVRAMRNLERRIQKIFSGVPKEWTDKSNSNARYQHKDGILELALGGRQPAYRLRFHLARAPNIQPRVYAEYQTARGMETTDLSAAVERKKHFIVLHAQFLPAYTVEKDSAKVPPYRLRANPGYYRIRFEGLDPQAQILSVEIDGGARWLPVESVAELEPTTFGNLYAPVAAQPLRSPQTWSGEVKVAGHQTLVNPLTIQPGTTVRLAPGATLILKGRLLAEGTTDRPIRFLPEQAGQAPWGAVVLSGRDADGSRLTHCEMAGGSGQKGDLFEYSAMFSVHEVKDVSIKDCLFRDNRLVDDMMHTVYSDIHLERVTFRNAFSDALDLDISQAELIDSLFVGSGNDAVDLMTTQATISGSTFRDNDDKGISVGENSQLVGINNRLTGNTIGIQAKDRSSAILFNQTFINNKTALHAYKKNWRYGEGGTIFLGKSSIVGGDRVAVAMQRSFIQLFDSYAPGHEDSKRVELIAVDGENDSLATEQRLLPESHLTRPPLGEVLHKVPQELLRRVDPSRRGDF